MFSHYGSGNNLNMQGMKSVTLYLKKGVWAKPDSIYLPNNSHYIIKAKIKKEVLYIFMTYLTLQGKHSEVAKILAHKTRQQHYCRNRSDLVISLSRVNQHHLDTYKRKFQIIVLLLLKVFHMTCLTNQQQCDMTISLALQNGNYKQLNIEAKKFF